MWERSLTPDHFRGGFREAGLYPLHKGAIKASKLLPSQPFEITSTDVSTDLTASNEPIPPTDMQLTCTKCCRDMTPMKLHVSVYFTKHLQAEPKKQSTDNRRVKPASYGEVLTSDEVMRRLQEKEKEKAEKEKEKAAKKAQKKTKGKQKQKQDQPEEISMFLYL